jgi:REP element-mobilizing transposase RayT
MARKPRVEFPGAFYHVIARGNHRQGIFRDDADRTTYLARFEHYRQRYNCTVYAYVLMSNHVHLLLETHEMPLSKLMHGLQFAYTQAYNGRRHLSGHLFQGRDKTILCDREAYLLRRWSGGQKRAGTFRACANRLKYRSGDQTEFSGMSQLDPEHTHDLVHPLKAG